MTTKISDLMIISVGSGTFVPVFSSQWTTIPTNVTAQYRLAGGIVTYIISGQGGVCTSGAYITGLPMVHNTVGTGRLVSPSSESACMVAVGSPHVLNFRPLNIPSSDVWHLTVQAGGAPPSSVALQALSLSNLTVATQALWTGTLTNLTDGSIVTATSSDGTVLTVVGNSVSGTFTTAGSPTITVIETLSFATNSPKTNTFTLTVQPVLGALSLNSLTATANSLWSSAITGATAGSTITATSSDGTALTVSSNTVSGTFTNSGTANITLTETLTGATNSPKSTMAGAVTVAGGVTPMTISGSYPNGTLGTAYSGNLTVTPSGAKTALSPADVSLLTSYNLTFDGNTTNVTGTVS